MYCANFITATSYPGSNTNEDCTLIGSDLKSCNYFLKFWRAVGIWKVVGIKEEYFGALRFYEAAEEISGFSSQQTSAWKLLGTAWKFLARFGQLIKERRSRSKDKSQPFNL